MKTTKYLFLTLLMSLMGMGAEAQQQNVLQVPDVTTQIGNVQLPVSIKNTDEIVGAQFDLTLPEGVTAEATGVLANRSDGHTVTVSRLSSGAYRVLLHSAQNRPLRGQSGVVMYLPINIPDSFEEGSEHPLAIANAVLGRATGENVLTEASAGMVRISKLPDLTVKSIFCDKQAINPGDRITCSWQVENIGELATGGGWSEQVSLVSDDEAQSKLIATTHYDGTINAGGIVSRQVEITLPTLLGLDGQAHLQVRVVPDSDAGERTSAQGNNTQTGSSLININKMLTLELSPNRVEENAGRSIAFRVNRSGRWTAAETFAVTATSDSRVSVPSSITIPANQSGAVVYFSITDNETLDENNILTITAQGNSYPDATVELVIEDNEYPDLTLTASKSVITEGETFQLTVTTNRVSAQPIEAMLTSENAKRFSFPQTVTIATGETSATVEVTAIDDEVPSLDLSNAFTASAPNHNKAEAIVLLKDNDLPVLELTLTPNKVQENAGVVAVAGVLRRTTHTDSKITVKLTDDADGGLYFGNRTLVLDKGVEEVHFNFGPVDNAQVDGDRTYTINAAVWLSSCSCNASGASAGYVEAQLQVLDNDGAALNVTSSLNTVKEGGKTTLTISRNTATTKALDVIISSDYEAGLTYDHTVTIPAGQQSTTVEATSAANSVQGDSHTVIFTVEAEGHASGTCYLMVTDQTLPDARISSITSDVTEAEVGTKVKLTIEVTNDGAAELPAEIPVKVYLRGDATAVGMVYTSEAIAVGENLTVTKTITLPTTVGQHSYYAIVNQENKVQELTYNNNTSEDVTITTVSPFAITVSTDKAIYKQGDKVTITGQLTGNGTVNADVEIYVLNEGTRQVQIVKTDETGFFTYEWQIYARQSGHFSVGACYPGEDMETEMAAFDVYGLRRTSNDFITCETKLGETYEGSIHIENLGLLPQTIASFEVVSKPETCDVILEAPSVIAANGIAELKYKLTGNAVTETTDWETISLQLTTNEGSSLTITLYYFCAAQHAVLTTNTTNIKTTMTKETTREYLLNVMNTGKGSTGKIYVQLPNVEWMKLGTQSEMPSLEYGETATISLLLTPTDDMSLNLPYTGKIALNSENGNGVTVSYSIEAVSEASGTLVIDVVDEYSYYTDEKPHVVGAGVVVKHPVTGSIVAQGETDANGIFSAELPEGYYSVTVSEDHHETKSGNILVDPGATNYQEVFLSYSAVTYSWDVVETEVEDEYRVETVVKYETNVPKPVVVVNLPTERPADGSIIAIPVTNKGLINAQHVEMNLNCTDGYELQLLNPDQVEILAPQQTYVFYARFTKKTIANANAVHRAPGNPNSNCVSIFAGALYDYMCGNAKNMEEALAQNGWGDCIGDGKLGSPSRWRLVPIPHTGPSWTGGSNGPRGGWTTHGPSSDGPGILETMRQWYCNQPCGKELTQALACEAAGKIIPNLISCPYNAINNCKYGSFNQCIPGVLGCTPPGRHTNCWLPYVYCMYDHFKNNRRVPSRAPSVGNTPAGIADHFIKSNTLLERQQDAFWRIIEEHFGDKEWLEYDNIELAGILTLVNELGSEHDYTADDFQYIKPSSVSDQMLERFIERVNNTFRYSDSGYEGITNYVNPETLLQYANIIEQCEDEAKDAGWNSVAEMYTKAYNDLKEYVSEGQNSVCASVTLKISQTMVMTRQAFRGTLTVFNGNEDTAMQDVKLSLTVTNTATGEVATSHEFQINAESLDGFTGELDLGSGWTLGANETGTATILFIPTKYAAPEEPVDWSFGGTLSYIDPFSGLEVARDLYPVTLTVKPSPELDLTYFMQRDIYGDDPLTEEVESSEPAEFALLINNIGNGDATNVRMVTNQPEIIENEKGLAINFEILSAQLNGGDKTMALGGSVATDFGTIPAHSQAYAQWWLQSSLLGHFTDYDVKATHVTSYGNPDLSLLNDVTIHELIRSIKVGDGSITGFVANDLPDAEDAPDIVYFTDGTTADVVIAANAVWQKQSSTEYLLTVTPSQAGWNYGHVNDPTFGYSKLTGIRRQSDGKEINLRNFWQTDRTLCDGKDWLYEYRLHFVDDFASGGVQTYVLTFEPVPDVVLEVTAIGTVPAEGEIAEDPIKKLTVDFNKEIDATTFTGDDITFAVQGVKKNANQISISTEDNKRFTLDMTAMNDTLPNGYYTLTVQTADITDNEGYQGKTGMQVGWIMYRGGLVQLLTSVYPETSGSIQREATGEAKAHRAPAVGNDEATAEYGSTITLRATPAEGYEFANWTLNGEVVGTSPELKTQAVSDMNIVANFTKKSYLVEVEAENGTIKGAGTGYYQYGEELTFTALPDADYIFTGWTVNGKNAGSDMTLTLTLDKVLDIKANFVRDIYHQQLILQRGWNWVSSYISEAWPIDDMSNRANRIVGQFDELINDPQFGLVGGLEQLTSGVAYKVEALNRFTTSFRGHLLPSSIDLKKGWNWIPYPWTEAVAVGTAITNAEDGDYLVSQRGFTEYADGYWEGTLQMLTPGEGYLYKSISNKQLRYDFTNVEQESHAKMFGVDAVTNEGVDVHRYPNTMNITARLYKDDEELTGGHYLVYAMANNELRGISEYIGNNYYITIYGDEPVDITFICESTETGSSYVANETLQFRDDVIGSRKSPFAITFGNTTGIEQWNGDQTPITVHSLEGILIGRNMTLKMLQKLPKGVYIINGQKCCVK